MRVDICVCTFRRDSVVDTLRSLDAQTIPEDWRLRIIVADNDERPSAEGRVTEAAAGLRWPVAYVHAPSRNIAIARNACLDAVAEDADWAAFIDDDEIADPTWIAELIAAGEAAGADAVFGPARAVYPETAPAWLVENDFHSNLPAQRGDVIETGYSCNAGLRWRDGPARAERFLLALGRTGGEDVEYFFRLHRKGARFAHAWSAEVREPVEPKRMTMNWLAARRYATGKIYGAFAPGPSRAKRLKLFATAALKAGYCGLRMLPALGRKPQFVFWAMRGVFHSGVCAGCLAPPTREFYGG